MFIKTRNGDNPTKYIPAGFTSLLIVAALVGGGVVLKNYFGIQAAAAGTTNAAASEDQCPLQRASMPSFLNVTPQVESQMKSVAVGQIEAVRQQQTLKAISYVQRGAGTFSADPTVSLERLRLFATAQSFGDITAKTGTCGQDGYFMMTGYVGGKPMFSGTYTLVKQPSPVNWRVADFKLQLANPACDTAVPHKASAAPGVAKA